MSPALSSSQPSLPPQPWAVVTVRHAQADDKRQSLAQEPNLLIGRSPAANVTLPLPFISASHCVLRRDDNDNILLLDTSSNGTFVDGKCVGKNNEVEVPGGAVITFSLSRPFPSIVLQPFDAEAHAALVTMDASPSKRPKYSHAPTSAVSPAAVAAAAANPGGSVNLASEVLSLRASIFELRKLLDQRCGDLEDKIKENDTLREQLATAAHSVKATEASTLASSRSVEAAASDRASSAERASAEAAAEVVALRRKLERSEEEARVALAAANQKIDSANEMRESAEMAARTSESERAVAVARLAEIEREASDRAAQLASAHDRLATNEALLERHLFEAGEKQAAAKRERDGMASELDAAQIALGEREGALANLRDKLEAIRAELAASEADLVKARAEARSSMDELETKGAQLDALQRTADDMRAARESETGKKSEELAQLTSELGRAQESLEKEVRARNSALARANQAERELTLRFEASAQLRQVVADVTSLAKRIETVHTGLGPAVGAQVLVGSSVTSSQCGNGPSHVLVPETGDGLSAASAFAVVRSSAAMPDEPCTAAQPAAHAGFEMMTQRMDLVEPEPTGTPELPAATQQCNDGTSHPRIHGAATEGLLSESPPLTVASVASNAGIQPVAVD